MRASGFELTGVFSGEDALLDAMEVRAIEQAAWWSTWHVFDAAWLQPGMADGIIRCLSAQQPIDIGQGENAGGGKEFRHGI
jgi:hypothetical protein